MIVIPAYIILMMLTWTIVIGQYVAIKACTCMYMDETGHISNFLVTNLIVILQWGNKGGEGEEEVEIIHMCIYLGYYLSE